MLTPDQINQARSAAGAQPLTPSGQPQPANFLDSIGFKATTQTSQQNQSAESPGDSGLFKSGVASPLTDTGAKVANAVTSSEQNFE